MAFFAHRHNQKALGLLMVVFLRVLLLLFVTATSVSCTSLGGQKQHVKVVTSPPGAHVYVNSRLIGTTPTYVEIIRRKKESLVFKYEGIPDVKVDLTSKYRWGDSFGANFLFIWYWPLIPVGWGLDYYSETAFNYEPLPHISLGAVKKNGSSFGTPIRRLVVAPPKGIGKLAGDEIAFELEADVLKRYKNILIEPYYKTLNVFRRNGYDEESLSAERTELLFADLHASSRSEVKPTHVLESVVTESEQEIKAEVSMVDIYTGERTNWNVNLPKKKLNYSQLGPYQRLWRNLIFLIPNSVGLSISKSVSSVRDDLTGYFSEEVYDGNAFSYLSNISVKNIKVSQAANRWKFHFDVVSSLDVSYKRLRFRNDVYNAIQDKRYDWFNFLGGVGPQVGMQTFGGVFYLEAIPSIGLSWIRWDGDKQNSRGQIGFQAELGYLYFISRQINMRIFVNSTSVSTEQWDTVLRDSGATNIRTTAAGYTKGGISFGYFFPEVQTISRKWVGF